MNEKFCNRCGSPLDGKSNICPSCNYDVGKRNLASKIYKIIAALLVIVLVSGILLTMQKINSFSQKISSTFNYQTFESAKGSCSNEWSKK